MSRISSPSSASAWHTHWQQLAPRERQLLQTAAIVVAVALLWWLALAPALDTLRKAPARHADLDAQWQTMQALQAEAQLLQNAPRLPTDAAIRALQASVTEQLGPSARLSITGDRATLTLQGTSASTLAAWLAQARANAHAITQEARLVRNSNSDANNARWDGTVVLALPAH